MKTPTVSMRLEPELLRELEDYRRAQKAIPNRTDALRQLVRIGMDVWRGRETQTAT